MPNSIILKDLIEGLNVSVRAFETKIKVGGSSIARAIERNSKIKEDTIDKIVKAYPNVNRLFLEGQSEEMFLKKIIRAGSEAFPLGPIDDEVTETTKSGNEFIDLGSGRYVMLVPKVPEYAYGGYLGGYRDPEFMESLPKHSVVVGEKHRGKYIAFEMRGESMVDGTERSISPKDTVVGRSIPKQYWTSKLHIHRYKEYVIVHRTGGILVKQIIAHDTERGVITIHSYNPDKEEYPDTEINLAEVKELYNVVDVTKPR